MSLSVARRINSTSPLLVVASIALLFLVLAQQSSAQSRHLKLLEIKLLKAETEYDLNATRETRTDLIHALEQHALASCSRKKSSLIQQKLTKSCFNLIERIEQLFSPSPVPLCIRQGVDSPACLKAFAEQRSLVASPTSRFLRDKVLQPLPVQDFQQRRMLLQAYKDQPDEPQRKALEQHFEKTLRLLCQESALDILTQQEFETLQGTNAPSSRNPKKELEDLLHEFQPEDQEEIKRDAQNEAQAAQPVRVWVIPPRCQEALDEVAKALPQSYLLSCYLKGTLSPSCRHARQKSRLSEKGSNSGSSSSRELMQTF